MLFIFVKFDIISFFSVISDKSDDLKTNATLQSIRGFVCKVKREEKTRTCVLPQVKRYCFSIEVCSFDFSTWQEMINDDNVDCADEVDHCAGTASGNLTRDTQRVQESTCVSCISGDFVITKQ